MSTLPDVCAFSQAFYLFFFLFISFLFILFFLLFLIACLCSKERTKEGVDGEGKKDMEGDYRREI